MLCNVFLHKWSMAFQLVTFALQLNFKTLKIPYKGSRIHILFWTKLFFSHLHHWLHYNNFCFFCFQMKKENIIQELFVCWNTCCLLVSNKTYTLRSHIKRKPNLGKVKRSKKWKEQFENNKKYTKSWRLGLKNLEEKIAYSIEKYVSFYDFVEIIVGNIQMTVFLSFSFLLFCLFLLFALMRI